MMLNLPGITCYLYLKIFHIVFCKVTRNKDGQREKEKELCDKKMNNKRIYIL